MTTFDPNGAASVDSGVFGLPCSPDEAALVIVPVPWDATTSYRDGTARGPAAVLGASRQIDLFDLDLGRAYEGGIAMLEIPGDVAAWNKKARKKAARIIEVGGVIGSDPDLAEALAKVNAHSAKVNEHVRTTVDSWMSRGKLVGVLGGDHSVPLGAIQAVAARHPAFGILHLDAHSDTRRAYEGFTFSHASIMDNVLELVPQATRLVQVGIRDFCEEEHTRVTSQPERVKVHWDARLAAARMAGTPFNRLAHEIVEELPKDVYLSFDIDGLDPTLCPSTGTPVPGGLSFNEAVALVMRVVHSGRRIIGFDLCEVAPGADEWDANVGARLLYKMCLWTLASQGSKPKVSPAAQ